MAKTREKEEAIKLRKKGFSYRELLEKVPVAKSTLSLWLRSVGLSKKQKQRLTEKRLMAMRRGAEARRRIRILTTERIKDKARKEIGKVSKRDLWLVGIALYWAEGDKEREKGSLVGLGNSDPYLINIFLDWLRNVCKIPKESIKFRIFLHENNEKRLREIKRYWSRKTGFPINEFRKVTWKKNKIKTKRRKVGEDYYGLLKVTVKRSTNFNRKIEGWKEGIYK